MIVDEDIIDMRLAWAFRTAAHSHEPTKVGCVIHAADGAMVGVGWNITPLPKSVSRDARRPYAVHAESIALVSAFSKQPKPEPLTGCTAYVTHHPCVSCMAQLALADIKTVIYASMPDLDRYDPADLAHAAQTLGLNVIPHSYTDRRPS